MQLKTAFGGFDYDKTLSIKTVEANRIKSSANRLESAYSHI